MSYRTWVIIATGLFTASIALGVSMALFMPNLAYAASPFAEELLEQLGRLLAPFSVLTAVFIFLKNVMALVISFTFSPILCLSPILALTLNGWLIGFVSPMVVSERSLAFLLAGLLPHGIFEIPALILGGAAALSFGTMAMVTLFKRESRELLLPRLKQNLRYLLVAIVLLVPAAIIETYLTPLLLTQ